MAVVDAREDFARARRAALVARAARWLHRRRRPGVPRTLDRDDWLPWGAPELRVLPLAEVVGTVEPTISFRRRVPAGERARADSVGAHRARTPPRGVAAADRRAAAA
jgi:hypothetical protein